MNFYASLNGHRNGAKFYDKLPSGKISTVAIGRRNAYLCKIHTFSNDNRYI